jgi:hypothetical protein
VARVGRRRGQLAGDAELTAAANPWHAAAPQGGSIMTVLGKILAILNLVLSLAVGAFIVMTYVARTNWHAAYVGMQNQVKVSQADALAYKKDMEQARGERAQLQEQLDKQKAAAEKEQQSLTAQINDFGEKLKRAGEENAKLVAAHRAYDADLKRRANEVDYLKKLIGDRDAQLSKKDLQVNQMRALMVEAQINFKAEHERNERLLEENERLSKDNRQIRQVSTSPRGEASKRNPPPEDIDGRVTAYDSRSGLLTLNVGSDAGLAKGNTLEIFRTLPEPAYLGTIRIMEVRPNEAVAKPLDRLQSPPKAGDRVSSNILGRR